ncbi:MAG: magnesium/cobalt transporter CorA [Pseudomonadota bacterium]|jgi:magnesium transporter
MLNAFALANGRLVPIELDTEADGHRPHPVWIDLVDPTPEELAWVEQHYHLKLFSPTHLRDIEASARFYEEGGRLHLRSDFLLGKESGSHSVAVAFVLSDRTLFSVHKVDLPVFVQCRQLGHVHPGLVEDGRDVLIDLYGFDVEFSADALEEVYAELGTISRRVLKTRLGVRESGQLLERIAHAEHVNSRIRRNLMDTRRAISFLMRGKLLTPDQLEEVRQTMQDIDSLDGHTAFLFDKINFLMDSVVGFISINQNKIVRLFSVASVALLPPTLIASIYGMNFKVMPELEWVWGYPFALGLMAVSVAVPFWVFHRMGWLK